MSAAARGATVSGRFGLIGRSVDVKSSCRIASVSLSLPAADLKQLGFKGAERSKERMKI